MNTRLLAVLVVALAVAAISFLAQRGPSTGSIARPDESAVVEPAAPSSVDENSDGTERIGEQGTARVSASASAPLEASPTEEPVAQVAPGTLVGTVLDPSGNPIADAVVALAGTGSLGYLYSDQKPKKNLVTATSDEAGRFTFEPDALEEMDRAYVTAGHPDYAPSVTRYVEFADAGADLTVRLRVGARIRGEVWRSDDEPAPGRRVRLLQGRDSKDALGDLQMLWIVTDEHGRFDRGGLVPGEWGLVTYPDNEELEQLGGEMLDHMLQEVVTVENGGEAFVSLGARSGAEVRVRGTITKAGEAVSGFVQFIHASDDPGDDRRSMKVPESGTFELELESAGAWFVRATGTNGHTRAWFDLESGETNEITLEIPTANVRGRVVDADGAPVRGATVSHVLVRGAAHHHSMQVMDHRSTTNRDGEFELDAMEPGTYRVGASHPTSGSAESHEVTVGRADVDDLELIVRGDRSIEGRVVDADGTPITSAAIWIQTEGRTIEPITDLRSEAFGEFTSRPLPRGSYDLFAAIGVRCAWRSDVRVDASDEDASPPIELRLVEGATLAVTATEGGAAVPAAVRVFAPSGALLSGLRFARDPWSYRELPFQPTVRHVGPLPPGTFRVEVEGMSGALAEREVTLEAGERRELEITLR